MVSFSPMKLEAVPSSSTRTAERIALVASSSVTTRSSGGSCGSQACFDPSWNRSMPGRGRRARFLRGAERFGAFHEPTHLQHALRPRVAAQERPPVRHGAPVDRLMEVLGREIEIAGAKRLDQPCDLVHARPSARRTPAVDDPLRPMRLIGTAQAAEMPLAHAQQRSSLHAVQLLLPMQLNRIDHPGHSDLRQHAIPPVKTRQIVCSQTVAELVPPVAGETAGAMISRGGERPSGFWWARPRYQTWPTGCCGLESGDAKAIPVRKWILSRSPAPPPWSRGGACHDATEALPPGAGHCPGPSPCGRR